MDNCSNTNNRSLLYTPSLNASRPKKEDSESGIYIVNVLRLDRRLNGWFGNLHTYACVCVCVCYTHFTFHLCTSRKHTHTCITKCTCVLLVYYYTFMSACNAPRNRLYTYLPSTTHHFDSGIRRQKSRSMRHTNAQTTPHKRVIGRVRRPKNAARFAFSA